jgi:hypothetical protein
MRSYYYVAGLKANVPEGKPTEQYLLGAQQVHDWNRTWDCFECEKGGHGNHCRASVLK